MQSIFKRIFSSLNDFRPGSSLWLLVIIFFSGCNKEEGSLNQVSAPSSFLFINKIGLDSSNALVTKVKLYWNGTSQNGYIKGYKVAWDLDSVTVLTKLNAAKMITRTDSTFLLDFSGSSSKDYGNVYFGVQAIDDKNVADPNPKLIKIPLKNSAPVIKFKPDEMIEKSGFQTALSLSWSLTDVDGIDNIDSLFIKVNSGKWISINKKYRYLTLVPENDASATRQNALIYEGSNLAKNLEIPTPLGQKLEDFVVSDTTSDSKNFNVVYLMAKDLAGKVSYDTSAKFVCQVRKSDFLVLDCFRASNDPDNKYDEIFKALNLPYQKFDLLNNRPASWLTDFYLMLNSYKKVFWYSDFNNVNANELLLLDFAAPAFVQYLRNNGKLIVSATFPDGTSQAPLGSPIYTLLPMDSVTKKSQSLNIRGLQPIFPKQDIDTISASSQIKAADLFAASKDASVLYDVPLSSIRPTGYTGPTCLAAKRKDSFSGKTNLVFFACDVSQLDGRKNLKSVFETLFKELDQ